MCSLLSHKFSYRDKFGLTKFDSSLKNLMDLMIWLRQYGTEEYVEKEAKAFDMTVSLIIEAYYSTLTHLLCNRYTSRFYLKLLSSFLRSFILANINHNPQMKKESFIRIYSLLAFLIKTGKLKKSGWMLHFSCYYIV